MRRWLIGAGGLFVVTQVALAAPDAPTASANSSATTATTAPTAALAAAATPFTLLEGQEVARTLALRDLAPQVFGYNHDGARILAVDAEGPALLDVRGQPRARLECSQDEGAAVVDMSHGRDGAVVAALFANGRACVWDTASQALLSSAGRSVVAMALGDRDTLVYGYADGKLEGRNPRSGARRWTRNPDLGPIVHLRFQPHGPLVAASTGTNGVAVVDTRSGRLVRGLRGAPAWSAAFDPSGEKLAVGRGNGRVEIWNTKQWYALETVRVTGGDVIDLDFSPDGSQLVAATVAGVGDARVVTLEVWDFAVGELVFREAAPAGPGPTRARFDTIGDRLLAGNGPPRLATPEGPGASRMWSKPGARQIPRALPSDEPPHHRYLGEGVALPGLTTVAADRVVPGAVAIAPNGAHLLVRSAAPTPVPASPTPTATTPTTPTITGPVSLALVDVATGAALPLAGSTDAVGPFVFSPDGGRVAAVVRGAPQLWDTATGALLGRVGLEAPRAAALLGERLAFVGADGKVYVGTLERLRAIPGVTGATTVALDPLHDDRVAIGTGDGGVRILDVRKGTAVGQWGIHAGSVGAVAFSADGRFLATAGVRAGGESAAVTVLAALPDDVTDPWTAVVDALPTRLAFEPDGAGVIAVSALGVTVVRREVGAVVELSAPAIDAAFTTAGAPAATTAPAAATPPPVATPPATTRALRWVDSLGAVRRVAVGAAALPAVPRGRAFATSADGRFSVTADGDRVSVWDDRTGLLLRALPPAGQAALRCVFDDAGDRVAVLYTDRSIEVYEVESGEVLRNLPGPPVETGDWARFSEDGALLWTFAGPREVVGWSIATGAAVERQVVAGDGPLEGDDNRALSRFVRIADAAGTAAAWLDTYATSPLRLTTASEAFRPVAAHPARKLFFVATEGGVARLDPDTRRRVGPVLRVDDAEPGAAAAVSPDGAWLAVAYAGGLIRVWDLQRNVVVASLGTDARLIGRGPPAPVGSLAFDAAGELVLARDPTGYPRLFEWRLSMEAPQAGSGAGPVLPSADVTALAVTPDGRTLVSAHGDANGRAWDLVTGEQTAFYWGHAARITTLAVAAGGQRVVTGSEDGTVRGWDVSSALEKVAVNTFADPVRRLAVSADGWRFAALGDGGVLRTWDGARGRALRRWRLGPVPVASLDLGAAGERVSVTLTDGTSWVLDPATGAAGPGPVTSIGTEDRSPPSSAAVATVRALAEGLSPVTAAVATPDARTYVTAGADGRIRLWDLGTASLRGTLTAMTDGSWVIDRPDGTRFASETLRDGSAPLLYRTPPK